MSVKTSVAVTSFSPDGFDLYGRDFLKSFLHHTDLNIIVFIEAAQKKLPKNKRIAYRDLWDIPGCREFVETAPPGKLGYRWDSGKFCRKVYAQIEVISEAKTNYVYWFDADVVWQKKLEEKRLRGWLKTVAVAYMGRVGYHCCSSFVGYNLDHADLPRYVARMMTLYDGKELFSNKEGWTDCDAMAVAMAGLETNNICAGDPRAAHIANVFDIYLPGHHKKGTRKYGAKGG